MRKILLSLVLPMVMLCGATYGVINTAAVYAEDDICSDPEIDDELKKVAGCSDFKEGDKKTAVPMVLNLINVVLTFVGLIAVGVIVYGGILYATSVGDASKITKAKNCILYGVVGLVVALMSFAIVAFVNTSVLKK